MRLCPTHIGRQSRPLKAFQAKFNRIFCVATMFKIAVELAMLQNIIANLNDIDKQSLARLRGGCVDEVKRLGGNITFENALDWQKG